MPKTCKTLREKGEIENAQQVSFKYERIPSRVKALLNTNKGHGEKVTPAPSKGNRIHPPETPEAH